MTSYLGERLKRERHEKGWSQSELARRSQLSNEYISKIELGKVENVGIQTLKGIADALGVPLYRLQDFGEDLVDELTRGPEIKEIPLLSGTVSASTFILSFNDWEGETIGVPLKNIQNKVAWRVSGRSMEPVIGDGDIVIIDNSVQFSDGDYVIAENDNGVTVKKLKLLKDGHIELRPLNPDFPTIVLKSDKQLEILGVVIQLVKNMRRKK